MFYRKIALALSACLILQAPMSVCAQTVTVSEENEAQMQEEQDGIQDAEEDEKIPEDNESETADPDYRNEWVFVDGQGWYYYGNDGEKATGWILDGGEWYYLDGENEQYPGLMLKNQYKNIDGEFYSFNDSGVMETGWLFEDGEGWYYYGSSGARQYGWLIDAGKKYYLDGENEQYPGLMLKNCKIEIDGNTYNFDDSGAAQTGWLFTDGEGWYYYAVSGQEVSGWVKDAGKWYYLDPENNNIMVSDCEKEIDGQRYVFLFSGDMLTGWYFADGEGWYYYNENGYLVSGWCFTDNNWYYLDPDNNRVMTTETWKVIDGDWYSFYSNGAMRRNWQFINGAWYYFGSDGSMRTGWQTIDGLKYYFYCENDENGGVWGAMAANVTIDGIRISSDGSASIAYTYAEQVLNQVGWNLRAAFNWSAGLKWTATTANPSPGSEWFAVYGFQNKTGNCYVMAATFYYMARLLGYDAHQVTGYVPTVSGGNTPHSWVEIDMNGSTYVFDPDFTNETGRNGYQISYGTSGTWRYTGYYRMN